MKKHRLNVSEEKEKRNPCRYFLVSGSLHRYNVYIKQLKSSFLWIRATLVHKLFWFIEMEKWEVRGKVLTFGSREIKNDKDLQRQLTQNLMETKVFSFHITQVFFFFLWFSFVAFITPTTFDRVLSASFDCCKRTIQLRPNASSIFFFSLHILYLSNGKKRKWKQESCTADIKIANTKSQFDF